MQTSAFMFLQAVKGSMTGDAFEQKSVCLLDSAIKHWKCHKGSTRHNANLKKKNPNKPKSG